MDTGEQADGVRNRETQISHQSEPQSPALVAQDIAASAFEMKCLLNEVTAKALEESLSGVLNLDRFAEASQGQYRITTLSTDTGDLAIYHRQSGYAQKKLRVRRYGNESCVYLEQKTRRGNKVRKFRTIADHSELLQLCSNQPTLPWSGDWFQARVLQRRVQPICLMTYERRAWFGESEYGPIRLTMDRNLCGMLTSVWSLEHGDEMQSVVNGVVCEFKFSTALPQVFKQTIQKFDLAPGGFSKYRNCLSKLTGLSLLPSTPQENEHA